MIFAHRGANREAAENTRSAFDRALAYPIDGIETDIQLTRDGVAVLWHDRFLGKLGMKDKRIDDFDLVELLEMDFAAHSGEAGKRESVMSLREFLDAYRMRCHLLLEIKNRGWESFERHKAKVQQTLALVGEVADGVLVSSFNLDSLLYAHHCAPDIPLVLNLEPEHDADYARGALEVHPFFHGLCVHIDTLDEEMVGVLREHGKCLAVYTCNSDEEISRALALGVDILISDLPQKALALRAARNP